MNKDRVILEMGLRKFGQKGWMRGNLFCPECGRNDKFGILFVDNSAVTRCFYCAKSFSIFSVLKGINRLDLLDKEYYYQEKEMLSTLDKTVVEEEKSVEQLIYLRDIDFDEYLNGRGFLDYQYQKFNVCVSDVDPKVDDMIVFNILQRGRLSGWIARSRKSKEWHHENLKRHKELGEPLVLRYRNSNNDFSKMLGGLDEITDRTHTLILVEGLMDKANIDRLMDLDNIDEIKCCFTFGSNLSEDQIKLIPNSVEEIILMYDLGTFNIMQDVGSRLLTMFDVKVAILKDDDIDPGNMDKKYLFNILENLKEFLYFYNQLKSYN